MHRGLDFGSISSREPGKLYKSAGTYKQLQNETENIKRKMELIKMDPSLPKVRLVVYGAVSQLE